MESPKTVFEAIKMLGHDEDFQPVPASKPTDCKKGSFGQLEVLRLRVEAGEDLFHDDDCKHVASPDEIEESKRLVKEKILSLEAGAKSHLIVLANCVMCNEVFMVDRSWETRKTCSDKCYNDLQRVKKERYEQTIVKPPEPPKKTKQCAVCGKLFLKTMANRKRKTCDKICAKVLNNRPRKVRD